MKTILLIFSSAMILAFSSFSHGADPVVSPSPTVAVAQAAVVAPTPVPVVSVAEPAAPPQWASDLIVSAQQLPIVGPFVSKALLYLGIISSILTALIAFLLTALSAASGVLNIAGLASFAEKIQLFKNGKIMYYLKYLSMFNAKKPEAKIAEASSESTKAAA